MHRLIFILFSLEFLLSATSLRSETSKGNDLSLEGWPRFNGPNDNAKSPERNIAKSWEADGPTVLWETPKGEGYASPAISGNTLVLFHRTKGMEVIEARNAQDGRTLWAYEYPVEYEDRYG